MESKLWAVILSFRAARRPDMAFAKCVRTGRRLGWEAGRELFMWAEESRRTALLRYSS